MSTVTNASFQVAPGVSFPVESWIDKDGNTFDKPKDKTLPLVSIPLMSDFQLDAALLMHRIEHPENYASFEDVNDTIERIKSRLLDNIDQLDTLRPDHLNVLRRVLFR